MSWSQKKTKQNMNVTFSLWAGFTAQPVAHFKSQVDILKQDAIDWY